MNIIFDENIPYPLLKVFPQHQVTTVQKQGWSGTKNGALLHLIEGQFDLLLLADKNLRHQQNLVGRKIALIELPTNRWPLLQSLVPQIVDAVNAALPGSYKIIEVETIFVKSKPRFVKQQYSEINAIELLKTAVSIPSISSQETEVANYLVSQMKTFADEAFVDASGSAVAKVGHGPLHVIFLGHIDTVTGDIPVRIEDGKLFGRGSVDAKGPFCTAVVAASRLSEEVKSKLTLTLIGATEEEARSSKGARYAVTAYAKPDWVIIGEPSNWDAITLGYKGRLLVTVNLEKDHFHSAGEGTTAAEDVVEVWTKLKKHSEDYNQDKKSVFDQVQIALQGVSSTHDGLTQKAEATIGYRLPLAVTPEALREQISALVTNVSLTFWGDEIAYRSEKDTTLTRALRLAIRELGGTPRFKVKTGTADMNVVAPHWNVPMVAYGPGDSALDHTPNEHVDLAEYEKAIDVLVRTLTSLAMSRKQ